MKAKLTIQLGVVVGAIPIPQAVTVRAEEVGPAYAGCDGLPEEIPEIPPPPFDLLISCEAGAVVPTEVDMLMLPAALRLETQDCIVKYDPWGLFLDCVGFTWAWYYTQPCQVSSAKPRTAICTTIFGVEAQSFLWLGTPHVLTIWDETGFYCEAIFPNPLPQCNDGEYATSRVWMHGSGLKAYLLTSNSIEVKDDGEEHCDINRWRARAHAVVSTEVVWTYSDYPGRYPCYMFDGYSVGPVGGTPEGVLVGLL